jgi:hypothetical protein
MSVLHEIYSFLVLFCVIIGFPLAFMWSWFFPLASSGTQDYLSDFIGLCFSFGLGEVVVVISCLIFVYFGKNVS